MINTSIVDVDEVELARALGDYSCVGEFRVHADGGGCGRRDGD